MIEIKNIDFKYKKKKVFDNFSLNIRDKGKFIAIIGPNGCGKTTLLKLITGDLKTLKGNILFEGKEVSTYKPELLARSFSIIRQNSRIQFPYACLEVVMMGRNPYKQFRNDSNIQEDLDIVLDCMKKTDTIQFAHTPITQLSGGEYQRVLLARALAQKTEIIFLDEAFSAMDISYKIKLLKILKDAVKQEGITVIAVMHDINLAYKFGDKVIVIKEGKIVKIGDMNSIMDGELIKSIFGVDVEMVKGKGFLIE